MTFKQQVTIATASNILRYVRTSSPALPGGPGGPRGPTPPLEKKIKALRPH